MTNVDPDQVFLEHYGGRTREDVTAQLEAEYQQFRGLPSALQDELTLHYVRCKRCGVKFFTVLNLSEPALVYVAHTTPERPGPRTEATSGMAENLGRILEETEWASGHRNYTNQRWVTPWWPWADGPGEQDSARDLRTFPHHPVCKCQKWRLPWRWLVERIGSGATKTDVTPNV